MQHWYFLSENALISFLLFRMCFLFVLSFLGILYPYNRGALSTALVLAYAVTSVVAGSTAAYFHSQFAETGWVLFS